MGVELHDFLPWGNADRIVVNWIQLFEFLIDLD